MWNEVVERVGWERKGREGKVWDGKAEERKKRIEGLRQTRKG